MIASCASDKYGLRDPKGLSSIGHLIGLKEKECISAVSSNPLKVLTKANSRNNPDEITKGMKVVDWGTSEKKKNSKHGWY